MVCDNCDIATMKVFAWINGFEKSSRQKSDRLRQGALPFPDLSQLVAMLSQDQKIRFFSIERDGFVAVSQLSQGIQKCRKGIVMLLELAMQVGLDPKKVAATKGGEYGSRCPACPDGGNDRFRIWPNQDRGGRYWCRRCSIQGDSIQFCRDFLGMTFKEAVARVGEPYPAHNFSSKPIHLEAAPLPAHSWQEKAEEFCETSHRRLLIDREAAVFLRSKYGLTADTIHRYRIGWNPEKRFQYRSEWGLDEPQKKLCLPRGPVIADMVDGGISKLKIRDLDWAEGNPYGKYKQIPGGSNRMSIVGFRANQVALVVESEFDAMLLVQEIGEFCTCVALGGATKKPDLETFEWLRKRARILYSLDCDEAGREQYDYWRSAFPNLRAWPAETRKSPADSFILDGLDLRKWFEGGLRYWEGKG